MRDIQPIPKGRIRTIFTRVVGEPRNPKGWVRDPKTGLYLKIGFSRNMIVLAGLSAAMKWMQYGHASAGGTVRYMEVGTGNTIPSKSDTALVAAVERVAIASWDNDDIDSDPPTMIAHYLFDTDEGNGALMECGLFQNASGAPMYCRGLFGIGEISGATKADPCVITAPSHGLSSEDKILIQNVAGMTELNDNSYYVDVLSVDTLGLYTDADLTSSVDSSAYGTYTEASPDIDTWKKVIPKSTSETLTIDYTIIHPAD